MQQGNEGNVSNNDGVSINILSSKLSQHFTYLKSKWKVLLIYFVIFAALGLTYAIVKKPSYTAQTTFTIDDVSGASSLSGLASQLGISMGGGKNSIFAGYNIISFFQSRLMVQKTLLTAVRFQNDSTPLVNRYIEFNGYRKKWQSDPKLRNLTFVSGQPLTRLQDSVLGEFYQVIVKKQLDVERTDKRLTILSLAYTCEDEEFAKDFSETLAKNVIDFYTENRTAKIVRSVNILQHQVDSVKARLGHSMTNVAASSDAIPNANPLRRVLNVSAQNKGVDVEIEKTSLMQLEENLQTAKVSLYQETPLIEFIDRPILPLYKARTSLAKGAALGGFIGLVIGLCIVTFRRKKY